MARADTPAPQAAGKPDREAKKKPCTEGQTPEEDDCLPVQQHLHGLWQVLGLDDEDEEEHWEEREKGEKEREGK